METTTSPEPSTQLLKQKYDLHKAPEVIDAAKRTKARTGERVPQNPTDLIHNYLGRFREITDREDPDERELGLNAVKRLLHEKFVIKYEEIPESYWQNQLRIIRERGQGANLELMDWEEQKRQNAEAIISDQTSSLDNWVDYLSSSDAPYSDALKYWALRNVLSMGEYDKDKKVFQTRSKGTTKPFPSLNREALAYVIDAVDKKYAAEGGEREDQDTDPEFEKLLQGEVFSKMYGYAVEHITPVDEEVLKNATGEWVRYDQGSDHKPLVESLQGYGTGWCTAGESTAKIQLRDGDFYVYYSYDPDGKPVVPRVAIRMEEGRIAEVRGVAAEQNLDQYVAPVVEAKLEEFPDGKSYQKKVEDMKHLTEIDKKMKSGIKLEAADIVFLYEVEHSIQGFGYQSDPRIKELQQQRNLDEDMPIALGIDRSQIAFDTEDINSDTRAYVGPIQPDVLKKLKEHDVEYVYVSFPEGRVQMQQLEVGGKTKGLIWADLRKAGVDLTTHAKDMIANPDFVPLPQPEVIDTIRLKIKDLGFTEKPSTNQLYGRAREFGLGLCPPDVGLYYKLQNQAHDEGVSFVAMKEIRDSNRTPNVFAIEDDGGVVVLYGTSAKGRERWNTDSSFIFQYTSSDDQNSLEDRKLNVIRSLLQKVRKA